jgi:hypothetical protein
LLLGLHNLTSESQVYVFVRETGVMGIKKKKELRLIIWDFLRRSQVLTLRDRAPDENKSAETPENVRQNKKIRCEDIALTSSYTIDFDYVTM